MVNSYTVGIFSPFLVACMMAVLALEMRPALANCYSFMFKFLYVMGKALSGHECLNEWGKIKE